MATTATKKPRTSIEAVPQLATLPERVAVLEIKVQNIDDKMDDMKTDVAANHASLIETLKEMRETSVEQHTDMAAKIKELNTIKDKWVKYGMVALAFAAGSGWIGNSTSLPTILKFMGL